MNRQNPNLRRREKTPLLALFLVGAGLVFLGVAALILLPRLDAAAGSGADQLVVPAAVDYPSPDIHLPDLAGNPVSLSDYRGQVVLVNNWATWCPPCKKEMPTLQAYYEDYRDQGFTIIAIESGEPVAEVAEFVQAYGLTFPVWPDPEQRAVAAFRNFSMHSSYVIDRSGQVRLAWAGAISRAALEDFVTPLLEQ